MHPQQRVKRAELASAARRAKNSNDPADVARVDELRRDYRAEALAAYVEKVVSAAPPLTDRQRERIVALLRPAVDGAA